MGYGETAENPSVNGERVKYLLSVFLVGTIDSASKQFFLERMLGGRFRPSVPLNFQGMLSLSSPSGL